MMGQMEDCIAKCTITTLHESTYMAVEGAKDMECLAGNVLAVGVMPGPFDAIDVARQLSCNIEAGKSAKGATVAVDRFSENEVGCGENSGEVCESGGRKLHR